MGIGCITELSDESQSGERTRGRSSIQNQRAQSWLPHGALDGRTGGHTISRRENWRDKVDWKRLVQFALLGSNDSEQYAILLVRVSIGLFFAISGANKLFVAGGTKPVYDTLVKSKVPFPRQTAYFESGVEFVGGSLLTLGFLSSPACVALLIDMTVATLTSALSTIPKGLSPLSWLDDFLYLPEVLYVLFFIWLICSGPGKFSVDYWLAGKLLS
jgi:putative oxidoreductase